MVIEEKLKEGMKTHFLIPGKYVIYFVGGWRVEEKDFRMDIYEEHSKDKIQFINVRLKEQSRRNGYRLKAYRRFELQEKGRYIVEMKNVETLVVKYNNLFISTLFEEKLSLEEISVLIMRYEDVEFSLAYLEKKYR